MRELTSSVFSCEAGIAEVSISASAFHSPTQFADWTKFRPPELSRPREIIRARGIRMKKFRDEESRTPDCIPNASVLRACVNVYTRV